jgi:leucyl aminopeptidase
LAADIAAVGEVGLGKKEELTGHELRQVIAQFAHALNKKVNSVSVAFLDDVKISHEEQAQMMAEGFLMGSYRFSEYLKKEKTDRDLEAIIFTGATTKEKKQIEEKFKFVTTIFDAVKMARDLVNEPGMKVTPEALAKIAQDIAKSNPQISLKVFDRAQCEKMGMGAFLAVAQGSELPPKFVHLSYKPKKVGNKRKLAIVGKAITYDTGGVSLKTPKYMANMKMDMAGAAVVLAFFSLLHYLQPDFEIMGIFAATPNVVSAKSYVPDDVVRAMNGKTIEIVNTDAEGRVTLADALSYAVKEGATEIVDFATLTGSIMAALGPDYTGLYGNEEVFKKEMLEAYKKSGEKVWEMPLPSEYEKMNKSEIADIANVGNSMWGGSITAALFLKEFVDEVPWVHLDIAGPAFAEHNTEFGPKGGTGHGVTTLVYLVQGGKK